MQKWRQDIPQVIKGPVYVEGDDPSTRKILEGETTFRLVYMQKFRSGWLPSGKGKEEKLSVFSS